MAHETIIGASAVVCRHGSRAFDQARMPSAAKATPACVTRAMPKRRCASGRYVTSMALLSVRVRRGNCAADPRGHCFVTETVRGRARISGVVGKQSG